MESATYSSKPKRSLMLIGVLLTVGFLFSISIGGRIFISSVFGITNDIGSILFISRIFYWLSLLLAWLCAFKLEKQNLLLWQERKYKFWVYIASVLALFFIIALGDVLINIVLGLILHHKEQSVELEKMIVAFKANRLLLLFTCMTAGIVEELVFRGYLLPRLTLLFKNDYIAIFISSALFGLIHYRFGTIHNIVGPFFIGTVLAFHYRKFRNIKMLIVFHFLWDLGALSLMMHSPPH